ncbi:glycoside hydrolase family 5 protein [Bipolaris zeicola 26-R-13]|uniref:Glycoside hydrolase family 5 protein n=1 Tax=Cochliobolus carbonum (strain 26-R-13) TaxID=930089 RepID=W6XLG7_COCC2|nr:glycoside hydrolase family 5 protein [Bipolaris zeicola 26-R-13]EUC28092.1 glycoside hydrolase family 5 protein [Bipolaris zeicola 26-R-13]
MYNRIRNRGKRAESIFAYEAQNEPMHENESPDTLTAWQCTIAQAIKDNMNDNPDMLVTTGGASYLATSVQAPYFSCDEIDVIGIHAYGVGDLDTSSLQSYVTQAQNADKKLIMQEWSACYLDASNNACNGGSPLDSGMRDNNIFTWASQFDAAGIPWFYWQIIFNADPHQDWDYAVGINDVNWPALQSASIATGNATSAFDFRMDFSLYCGE